MMLLLFASSFYYFTSSCEVRRPGEVSAWWQLAADDASVSTTACKKLISSENERRNTHQLQISAPKLIRYYKVSRLGENHATYSIYVTQEHHLIKVKAPTCLTHAIDAYTAWKLANEMETRTLGLGSTKVAVSAESECKKGE
eukprot:scaffold6778_cov80-Skeletonema_menzelii.AAC.1